jgi:hypothetical protein
VVSDDDACPTAAAVARALAEHGPVRVLGPGSVVGLEIDIRGTQLDVRLDGRPIRPPTAVFAWRAPSPALSSGEVERLADRSAAAYRLRQWTVMVRGLLLAWHERGVLTLNPPGSSRWDEKCAQLIAAAQVGFPTPPTRLTARADGAVDFARSVHGRALLKSFVPYHQVAPDRSRVRRSLAAVASTERLAEIFGGDAIATPSVLQEPIAATHELRVVVVGDRTFAGRFARTGAAAVDARRPHVRELGVEPSDLPAEVAARCVALVRGCGLHVASIDLVVDEAGEHWFLDLNPSGQFHWVAVLTGLPIFEAIAKLMASGGDGALRPTSS